MFGPSLALSHTCKTQSLSLLSYVLSKEQIERLTEYGKHPTLPRFSGVMEPIFLHSTGPLRQHKKSSGKIVYYRDFKDPEVKLYWTVPPQELEALSEDTIKLFEVDAEYSEEIKTVVRRLQQLEWLLRNAPIPPKYRQYQGELINKVIECYRAFAIIEPKQEKPKISGLYGWALSLFSAPRNEEERKLQDKIRKAKWLFNSIYMAMDLQINDNAPMENTIPYNEEIDEDRFENIAESVVSYLPEQDKINLCKIIGRNYCKDDSVQEEEIVDHRDSSLLSPQYS
ncbi:hypothetical protein [Legionella norrlandica]|uniref:hypothetical protein n=1 Tax=Legionella norrlandica TaxID=1498499 RepID=UPI0024099F54|nr:hypothetical protein [Legionella norrlandica]